VVDLACSQIDGLEINLVLAGSVDNCALEEVLFSSIVSRSVPFFSSMATSCHWLSEKSGCGTGRVSTFFLIASLVVFPASAATQARPEMCPNTFGAWTAPVPAPVRKARGD